MNRLWKKLHSQNNRKDETELHFAGATVRHKSPFESLEIPRNSGKLSADFQQKWVGPFYLNLLSNPDEELISHFASGAREIDIAIVRKLLGDFDWRSRASGAYFAMINKYEELDEIIGRHLVKSEVCCAGLSFCLALASFRTKMAENYLITYLDYYLDQNDLWFDQAEAFCALEYFSPKQAEKFTAKWESFIENKPNWDLERTRRHFWSCMDTLEEIKKRVHNIR